MRQPLVVVVHRHGQDALGVRLANDIIVEDLEDLLWRRHALAGLHHRGLVFLSDDVHAQLDAFVADEDGRSGNQLANFVLALAAKRAVKRIFAVAPTAVADLAHFTNCPFVTTQASFARRYSNHMVFSLSCQPLHEKLITNATNHTPTYRATGKP